MTEEAVMINDKEKPWHVRVQYKEAPHAGHGGSVGMGDRAGDGRSHDRGRAIKGCPAEPDMSC